MIFIIHKVIWNNSCTGTSIKDGGVKLVLSAQTRMNSYKKKYKEKQQIITKFSDLLYIKLNGNNSD
jgi:lambda repressor-like predicted transcriptional regulator